MCLYILLLRRTKVKLLGLIWCSYCSQISRGLGYGSGIGWAIATVVDDTKWPRWPQHQDGVCSSRFKIRLDVMLMMMDGYEGLTKNSEENIDGMS